MKKLLLISAIAALCAPIAALAESALVTPVAAGGTATAKVDFKITVPRVLFLQVGAGTSFSNNAAVNLIDFTVPAANVGDSTVVAATAGSGDLANGAVTVRVLGNDGNISLNSNTTGPLTTGTAGEVIGWNRISVASAALAATTPNFTNVGIAHPAFSTGTAANNPGTATTLTATNKVVRQEGKWTYSYANADVVAAGVYGGVNTNNGRVSYTASLP